ncbi:MAG TPA: NADP-dependent methylenetetrahydromethanopterin/methylenetetrahydrofolate dehydrogenase [Gemmatimonadaceae bacterium]|nr:NADP-dependent methylenetetrahydromethanopterin/methylenetetrahydrofolate dehydrogenase [Gemmatimonadaceae bacterium]
MRKLLLQLDSSRLPSVFDAVVAYDAGADELMSRGGITEDDVRDLIHGCIFTRGPKDLKNTAVFIGGSDMAAGERLLAAAEKAFFGPFRVSLMLDSNGSNTTAVAAVMKIRHALGDVRGKRVLVTAGTGPVGMRAAGLLARAGAEVTITSRKVDEGDRIAREISKRFGGTVHCHTLHDASEAARAMEGAQVLLNAGPAGIMLVPRDAWAGRAGLAVAVDLNAVPPLGIEGIEPTDDGATRDGVTVFGALGVGGFKMKVHKACIAKLFERNDLVLDAETIEDVAKELGA